MELERKSIEDRRDENFIKYARSRTVGVLRERYVAAVEAQDTEEAAEAAREYRNKLLEDCDSMMVPDRPNVNTEAWTAYRQALRNVPEQAGFPLAIVWPEQP